MTRLRGLAVWLTAVMTMAAGFPQSVCACAGRPSITAESSTVQACPCGGGCCASAATAKCCDGDRGPAKPDPRESGQTVCKKALAAPHSQISVAGNGFGLSRDAISWATVSLSDSHAVPSMVEASTTWELPVHSPPTDLLLLFQRFLI